MREGEWKLFDDEIPEYTTPTWYAERDRARHLEESMHIPRLTTTAALVVSSTHNGHGKSVVDCGSGDGGLLKLLADADPSICAWGYDLQMSNVEGARERGVDVRYGNVIEDDIEWASICVATEFIEHVVDPHGFVRRVAEHCEVLVCSSPRTERPGSAYPFHVWCWDESGYRALLEDNGFAVIEQIELGYFQVLRGVRK